MCDNIKIKNSNEIDFDLEHDSELTSKINEAFNKAESGEMRFYSSQESEKLMDERKSKVRSKNLTLP